MPKYGNLDPETKKLIFLTQLFCHVEELTNTFPTSSHPISGSDFKATCC